MLGTNDPHLAAAAMLEQSKLRDVPEKRFAQVKGPLAVRPVYVHKEGRILGLVFCTMVALLLFALLELLLRRAGLPLSGAQFLAACAPPVPGGAGPARRDHPRSSGACATS